MLICLEKHSLKVLNDECVLAAVFLDLRYQKLLSYEQMEVAKKHIIEVYKYINKKKNENVQTSNEINTPETVASDPLEMALRNMIQKRSETLDVPETSFNLNISEILTRFEALERVPLDREFDVIKYWTNIGGVFTELQATALVIFTAAATQVSVERAFSALKFILSDLRGNIDKDILEDILLLYLNNKFKQQ